MEMPPVSEPMVKQALLDEAIRLGSQSVTRANQYMTTNRIAFNAIADSLELLRSGRVDNARMRLEQAITTLTRMLK